MGFEAEEKSNRLLDMGIFDRRPKTNEEFIARERAYDERKRENFIKQFKKEEKPVKEQIIKDYEKEEKAPRKPFFTEERKTNIRKGLKQAGKGLRSARRDFEKFSNSMSKSPAFSDSDTAFDFSYNPFGSTQKKQKAYDPYGSASFDVDAYTRALTGQTNGSGKGKRKKKQTFYGIDLS